MDKYETAMKLDEIQRLIDKQFYHKALIIVDTLNLNKIKNSSDLNMIIKVLIECEKYQTAMELLLRVRKKVNSRRILHQLVHVSIQLKDVNSAEKFLAEFKKAAPSDTYQWVFTYQIYKLKGMPIPSCIEILEKLKTLDYREQWAYELARLYHKNGDIEKCVNECNDIVLWFSEGIFVEKAKLLRAYYLENLNPEDLLRQQLKDVISVETEEKKIQNEIPEDEVKVSNEKLEIDYDEKNEFEHDEENEIVQEIEPEIGHEIKHEMNFEVDPEIEVETQTNDLYPYEEEIEEQETLIQPHEPDTEQQEYVTEEAEESESKEYVAEEAEESESKEQVTEEVEKSESKEYIIEEVQVEDVTEIEEEQELTREKKMISKLSDVGVNFEVLMDEYLNVEDIKSQVLDSLEQIMEGYTSDYNMIISGDKKSGKSTIAKRMVMLLYQLKICTNTQLAQIDASKINQMNLINRKDQLINRCLIIENAGELSDESANQIKEIIETSRGKVLFILEDDEVEMNRFMKKHIDFRHKFDIWIHIPKYNEEELFSFVNYFLSYKEFSLSREATLYMKQYISGLVRKKEDNRLFLTMEKIGMAYHCAKERNKIELRNTTVSKRCNEIDFMTIEKDDFQ